MSESIQFRGPLEVEGPDDLDDDDNYMKPGMETAGLKNRQQKEQPSKKSLYFAVGCFIAGLIYFYSTYSAPFQNTPNQATKTMFGCNRNQYYSNARCHNSIEGCQISVEFTGKCVVWEEQQQPNIFSNMYRPQHDSSKEIPYIIINNQDAQRIIYVLDIFDHLANYTSLEKTITVQVEDYSLLNNERYHTIFSSFTEFIEKTVLNINETQRIYVARHNKSQGLISYLNSIKSNDTVFIIEPQILEEVESPDSVIIPQSYSKLLENSTLKIKLIYSSDILEGFNCKKNRILQDSDKKTEVKEEKQESDEESEEEEEEEKQQQNNTTLEVECIKIEDGNYFSQLIQP